MADATIEIVGQDDLPVIVSLYNQMYRPIKDVSGFRHDIVGRHNLLQMIARIGDQPVGFFVGHELQSSTFVAWHYGVLPDFRRQGVASQIMEAVHDWTRTGCYDVIRLECHNSVRPMLHLAINLGYDIVGIRWDAGCADNLIILEKSLSG